MGSGGIALGEEAGRLDHHVDAQVAPRQVLRVALREHLEHIVADSDAVLVHLDRRGECTKDRVVLQQVGHLIERAEVVDADEIDVGAPLLGGAEEVAANAAKAIDTDAEGHERRSFLIKRHEASPT